MTKTFVSFKELSSKLNNEFSDLKNDTLNKSSKLKNKFNELNNDVLGGVIEGIEEFNTQLMNEINYIIGIGKEIRNKFVDKQN